MKELKRDSPRRCGETPSLAQGPSRPHGNGFDSSTRWSEVSDEQIIQKLGCRYTFEKQIVNDDF